MTPWTTINPTSFLKDVADNGAAVLRVSQRQDVQSGYWWELDWIAADGQRCSAEAQTLTLLMRRAAKREAGIRTAQEQSWQEADPANLSR